MKISIEKMAGRVLRHLDENETLLRERMEYEAEGCDLLTLVEEELPGAAREAILEAAPSLLDDCKVLEGRRLTPFGEGRGMLELPPDCLRILYLRMEDWADGLVTLMDPRGEECSLRRFAWGRRKGRWPLPGAALLPGGALEVFGVGSPVVARLAYVADPAAMPGMLEIPRLLLDAVVMRTAERIS